MLKTIFCLGGLLGGLAAIYFLIFFRPFDADPLSKCHARLISQADKFATRYRACLLEQLQENDTRGIWNQMESAIKSCLEHDEFKEYLDLRQLGELGNDKTAILPPSIDSPCFAVVANTNLSSAEKELFKHAPKCKFHKAIGQEKFSNCHCLNGISTSVALGHFDQLDSCPFSATVKTFLEKISKVPFVDYFWMESRGTPFTVCQKTDRSGNYSAHPDQILHKYSIFRDPIDVTVCQVYFDTPLVMPYVDDDDIKHDMFADARLLFPKLLLSVIANSSFLPLRAKMDWVGLDAFYFNISNPKCVTKFLARKFCAD